jgi:hypothetical protein
MKARLLFCLLLLSSTLLAQLQSPEQFFGYKIGERYTPHWRIVEYYKHVAAAVPGMVKLQQYGQTYEGRPLMVAFISSSANLTNLEKIRTNNLALAHVAGSGGSTSGSPAIVWLSYNVHGNETSSSEASLLTLYALVDPSNTKTKEWLQNTVVVIDPCLNPDGRDRYINWFNSVVGVRPNATLDAREHSEPWPGGRTNHYNFDLNRDWAWQTQVETQQRVKLYNQWLPQIHVDFHEQSINSPYYFAPAAEPFHEVITPWQREFQGVIGRNHARYFDKEGWLYFTKELFDLLYPSYGDTYPTYSGAIGMTYEQAGGGGGGRAGSAVRTASGDTLTLYDRAIHHYTTSMSTIEIASQNAAKLVSEFGRFFNSATTNGVGDYKSYVIKYEARDADRISALRDLLTKNGIQYGSGRAGASQRGYNYHTGKEESFSIAANDLVIPSVQPKSALVKVLFEPQSSLSDTATYDITAWSLPYVYGLKAYATGQRLETKEYTPAKTAAANPSTDAYAYVARWSGIPAVKLASQLLQKGIKVRFNEQPFEASGQTFDRGALIILRTSNQYVPNLWNTVRELAAKYSVPLTPVSSGFVDKGYDFGSSRVRMMQNRRVALLTGEGVGSGAAGEVWHFFDQQINYPLTLINLNDLGRVRLSDYDVLIMPDGNYRFLSERPMVDQLRSWINAGGNLIAMEGAVAQLARQDWTIKAKKSEDTDSKDVYDALKRYENRERDDLANVTPGSIFKVDLDNTHPLAFGYPNYYYTLKQDDHIYEFIKEGGWNVGVIKREKQIAGFVGSKLQKRLQDGLLFGVQNIGRGNITYLADNVLFRSFWENGKLMFSNAVFLVGQ